MSEYGGTETGGSGGPLSPGPGPVPDDVPAEAPRQFTPGELAAAREQLLAQGGDLAPPPVQSAAELGMQALAAGAEAADPDTGEMLRAIRALQAKVADLEKEKRLATAPDVVKYTTALHDHLAVKATSHPVIDHDPDWGYGPVLAQTKAIAEHAAQAAESGQPGSLATEVEQVGKWVTRHARRFPHVDYHYILELAEDAAMAAVKLAA